MARRVERPDSACRAHDGRVTATTPLDGVRVLDLTRLLPGGFLGGLLADLGADVVKVEEPRSGDGLRSTTPRTGPYASMWWALGRGRRSLAVDLKDPRGADLLGRLAATADVLVEGFRPGVADRLGVGYADLSERNPRLVYASLTGYGSDGPMSAAGGHDVDYLAYAGVLGMTGPPGGPPSLPGVQVADLGGASMLGIGLLAALYRAQVTGRGAHVEVAMYDAALAWTSVHAAAVWATGSSPGPGGSVLSGLLPCYGLYACADGRHLAVGALEPPFWEAFCAILERPDLLPRASDPAARSDVAKVVATRTLADWMSAFDGVDACVAPVLELGEALAHPLAAARGMVRDAPLDDAGATAPTLGSAVRVDGVARAAEGRPPELGADSVALAAKAGLAQHDIDEMLAAGVLRQASATDSVTG
jgi:alpha-methylacyl-CoA racemase